MPNRANQNGIGVPPRPWPDPSKEKQEKMKQDVIVGLITLCVLIPLILAASAALFLVAWNVGLVPIVAACGATVGSINFWTALGGTVLLMLIHSIFRALKGA